MADSPSYPGAPRWLKVCGIIAIVLVLLAVIIVVTGAGGPHGPGRHMQSGDTGGQSPLSGVAKERAPSGGGIGGDLAWHSSSPRCCT